MLFRLFKGVKLQLNKRCINTKQYNTEINLLNIEARNQKNMREALKYAATVYKYWVILRTTLNFIGFRDL